MNRKRDARSRMGVPSRRAWLPTLTDSKTADIWRSVFTIKQRWLRQNLQAAPCIAQDLCQRRIP
jgi:hypothetical protein